MLVLLLCVCVCITRQQIKHTSWATIHVIFCHIWFYLIFVDKSVVVTRKNRSNWLWIWKRRKVVGKLCFGIKTNFYFFFSFFNMKKKNDFFFSRSLFCALLHAYGEPTIAQFFYLRHFVGVATNHWSESGKQFLRRTSFPTVQKSCAFPEQHIFVLLWHWVNSLEHFVSWDNHLLIVHS